ncbi:MAG: HD-GYP domain-containing protein [Firmicutes bacterium]|nr:HD-GYP domain-containing protein [Bacillota bacterium]
MRFMPIGRARPGERVARTVYASDGAVLLRAGTTLTGVVIRRLADLGFPGVYVLDPGEEDWHTPELVSDATRAAAMARLWHAFRDLQSERRLDVAALYDSVDNIMEEILSEPRVVVNLADLRSHDSYTFGHSVDVAVLCMSVGRALGLNRPALREIGLGALLHDVGKIGIPQHILSKPGPLTTEEWAVVREHPRLGFEILRRYYEIPVPAAHIALQHHERLDGSGYPRGLHDGEIHPYARIAAVADTYDAMRSTRVYRPGRPSHEVLDFISRHRGVLFAPEVVDCLLQQVAPYPVGTSVRLNSGEVGVVAWVRQDRPDRPVVRVTADERGRRPDKPVYRDLSAEERLAIQEVLDAIEE